MLLVILLCLGLVRFIELRLFLKNLSKSCHLYDRKYVDEHVESDYSLITQFTSEKYYLNAKWSAYNFIFLQGPSPLQMFFLPKILTLKNVYGDKVNILNTHN